MIQAWRRLSFLIGLGLLLLFQTGCVLDGFTLPTTYVPTHPAAGEPVPSGSTWKLAPSADQTATIYLRVFRVATNVYVMEQFVDSGSAEPAAVAVTTARFVPLGEGWHALHWKQKDTQAQGYHLVRSGQGAMALTLADVSAQAQRVIEAAQRIEGLRLSESKLRQGLAVANATEAQMLRFMKSLATSPALATRSMQAVATVPAGLAKNAYDQAAVEFSRIDERDFVDRERGAQIVAYFQALHAQGSGWGTYGLARLANNGWGVPKDTRQARQLASLAIDRQVPQAANLLGVQAYYGVDEPVNPARAVPYLQQAANAGEFRAFAMLGIAYAEGKGVARDDAKAKVWFEKAEPYLSTAKVGLARLLILEDQAVSDARAVALLDGAIAANDAGAYYWRAFLHIKGRGGPINQAAATAMYVAGAERGDPDSQWQAGERLLRGVGAPADRTAGERWLRAAAQAGVQEAQQSLQRLAQAPAPMSTQAPAVAPTDWPTKTIVLVVPSSQGSFSPTLAAHLVPALRRALGGRDVQIQLVDDRTGNRAATTVKTASPDGYTLLLDSFGMYSRHGSAEDQVKVGDFEHAGMVSQVPMVMVVHAQPKYHAFQDLEGLKRRVQGGGIGSRSLNSGFVMTFSSDGGFGATGCVMQLEQSLKAANVAPDGAILRVPYRRVEDVLTDLEKEMLDLACVHAAAAKPYIQSGKLKVFGVAHPQRPPTYLSSSPTLAEAGIARVNASMTHSMYAPAGTPASVMDRLSAALRTATVDPVFVQGTRELGALAVTDARNTREGHLAAARAEMKAANEMTKEMLK